MEGWVVWRHALAAALLGTRSLVHPLYTPCAYGPLTFPIGGQPPAVLPVSRRQSRWSPVIIPLPAILLLAGDDKDLLALPARVPNVAQAARREQPWESLCGRLS